MSEQLVGWSVDIVWVDEEEDAPSGVVRSRTTGSSDDEKPTAKRTKKTTSVAVDTLSKNLAGFAQAAASLVASAAQAASASVENFELDEVKVTAVMEQNGQFGFQGTSVGARVEGGLELIFKRVRNAK